MGGAFVLTLFLIPFVASTNIEAMLELVNLFSKNLRTAPWQELREFADSAASSTKEDINVETSVERAVQQCQQAFQEVQLFCSHEPVGLNIALTQQDRRSYGQFTTRAIYTFSASKRNLDRCIKHFDASIDSLNSVPESVQRKTIGLVEILVTVYSNGTIKFRRDGSYQQSKLEKVADFLVDNMRHLADDRNVHYFNYETKTASSNVRNAKPNEQNRKTSDKISRARTVVNEVVHLIEEKLSSMEETKTSLPALPAEDHDKIVAFYNQCKSLLTLSL